MPRFLFILFFISTINFCYAQKQKKDSIYYKIEKFSKKRKSTKFLYGLIFRKNPDSVYAYRKTKNASNQYRNKSIRNIYITSVDPFGRDAHFNKKDSSWVENMGNKLHIRTKDFAIKSYLLFKKGEKFNEQRISESERLLRSTKFVNRVNIEPIDSTATNDSVDISVKVLDLWSLKPNIGYSGKKLGLGITEENVLGFGHEFNFQNQYDFKNRKNANSGSYIVNNICGTFINASVYAGKDFDKNERIDFRINRNFFSPLTKWAGGIYLNYFKQNVNIPISIENRVFSTALIKVYQQDFWGGYQIPIFVSEDQRVSDNLVFAGRFQNYNYVEEPDKNIDPYDFFTSYHTFLASVGYSQRKYAVDKNVFQFNLPEDISYGKSFSVTGGLMKQNKMQIPYVGISAGFGEFGKIGYYNVKAQFGSFFKEQKNYRSTFRLDATYFTPLIYWKSLKMRHFVSPTLVIGNGRNPSYSDRINFSGENEFPVYDANYLGKNKFILRYQLQTFINKTWKNFHFSPYFTTALGWLSTDQHSLFNSKVSTKFGIGILIHNPYLIFNRFQISFIYYPSIPFDNKNVFEFNNLKNTNIPINSFSVDIPRIVNYNN